MVFPQDTPSEAPIAAAAPNPLSALCRDQPGLRLWGAEVSELLLGGVIWVALTALSRVLKEARGVWAASLFSETCEGFVCLFVSGGESSWAPMTGKARSAFLLPAKGAR